MNTNKVICIVIIIIFILIIFCFINNIENFDTSSSADISAGASKYYDWQNNPATQLYKKKDKKHKCPRCENIFYDDTYNIIIDENNNCRNCDITQNKDINKYVLKSSVPPCPNMNQFATKSMIRSCPDMRDYIKKSKIPPQPNMKDYILKTEIPACPKCPICPVCPICPRIPNYNDKNNDKNNVMEYNKGYEDGKKSVSCPIDIIPQNNTNNTNTNNTNNTDTNNTDTNNTDNGIFESIENWFKSFFNTTPLKLKPSLFNNGPISYSFGDDTGWGTNNPGYSLTGTKKMGEDVKGDINIYYKNIGKQLNDNGI